MTFDPRLYRQFLVGALTEGRMNVLSARYGVSTSTMYRMRKLAITQGALEAVGECILRAGSNYAHFVDGIDSGLWGDSHFHQLSERGLQPESQGRAQGPPRLASGWVNTGATCTWVILPPVPPDLASRLVHWGRAWRYQESSDHGTAQFYVGKSAASVVLHLRDRAYPDGLEDQVPKFQAAEAREWVNELLNAFPGLKVVNRPIWHADPKAHESPSPLPSGELNKRILGVESVGRGRAGPATEFNDSPPGPSLETAGIKEAQEVARAPFELASLRADIAALKESLDGMGVAVRELVNALRGNPGSAPGPTTPPPDDRRGYG